VSLRRRHVWPTNPGIRIIYRKHGDEMAESCYSRSRKANVREPVRVPKILYTSDINIAKEVDAYHRVVLVHGH
jgi:hypothetical protein